MYNAQTNCHKSKFFAYSIAHYF